MDDDGMNDRAIDKADFSLSACRSTAFYHDRVMMRSRRSDSNPNGNGDRSLSCAGAWQASDPDATSPTRLENV
jgi:hypothetical protein